MTIKNGFNFNGRSSSDFFIVKKKKRPFFASVTRNLLRLPNMPGAYNQAESVDVLVIEVLVSILEESATSLREREDEINGWLLTKEPVALVFDDAPNKTYYAFINGSLIFDEMNGFADGGTITFICPDPYKYGSEQSQHLTKFRKLTNLALNATTEAGKNYLAMFYNSRVGLALAGVYTYANTKFQGVKSIAPVLMADFVGKVSGSTVVNPHLAKAYRFSSLGSPSTFTAEVAGVDLDSIKTLSGGLFTWSSPTNGYIAQTLFSFNLIRHIEDNYGTIPGADTASKVQWIKNNVAKITFNWHGFGSSPSGNKATVQVWQAMASLWEPFGENLSGVVAKVTNSVANENVLNRIDANGNFHILAHADASNGTTASTINTDYVNLEVELKTTSGLSPTKEAAGLYEVSTEEYDKIFVDPAYSGSNLVQKYPYGVGGHYVNDMPDKNLIPPFTDPKWVLHTNATVKSAYELELVATGNSQISSITLDVKSNQTYTLTIRKRGYLYLDQRDKDFTFVPGTNLANYDATESTRVINFTTTPTTKTVKIELHNSTYGAGTYTFTNPQLELGSVATEFEPQGAPKQVDNVGTAETFPVVKATFNKSATFLSYVTDKDVVLLGRPQASDEVSKDTEQIILNDALGSLVGWTSAGTVLEDGVLGGNFSVYGNYEWRAQSFGSGSAWHGPALKKSLSKILTDFEVELDCTIDSNGAGVGRIEVTLLDVNSSVVGKMSLFDKWSGYERMMFSARAGDAAYGVSLYEGEGSRLGTWNNFNGIIRIGRKNGKWYAFIGAYADENGNLDKRLYRELSNITIDSAIKNISQIQLHAATYGTHPAPLMKLKDLKVKELFDEGDFEVPLIAKEGDVIEINHNTKIIRRNGDVMNDLRDPRGNLFPLQPGTNGITVYPSDVASIEITYPERFL
jgi:predicted phage tail component-like protein